jgi:hypothetical protein
LIWVLWERREEKYRKDERKEGKRERKGRGEIYEKKMGKRERGGRGITKWGNREGEMGKC